MAKSKVKFYGAYLDIDGTQTDDTTAQLKKKRDELFASCLRLVIECVRYGLESDLHALVALKTGINEVFAEADRFLEEHMEKPSVQ